MLLTERSLTYVINRAVLLLESFKDARRVFIQQHLQSNPGTDPSEAKEEISSWIERFKSLDDNIRGDVSKFIKLGFEEFKTHVQQCEQHISKSQSKKDIRSEALIFSEDGDKDTQILPGLGDYFLVVPLSIRAAQKYGKGTKWCISASEDNQFESYFYRQDSTFFFLIERDKKYPASNPPQKYAIEIKVKEDLYYLNGFIKAANHKANPMMPIGTEEFERLEIDEEYEFEDLVDYDAEKFGYGPFDLNFFIINNTWVKVFNELDKVIGRESDLPEDINWGLILKVYSDNFPEINAPRVERDKKLQEIRDLIENNNIIKNIDFDFEVVLTELLNSGADENDEDDYFDYSDDEGEDDYSQKSSIDDMLQNKQFINCRFKSGLSTGSIKTLKNVKFINCDFHHFRSLFHNFENCQFDSCNFKLFFTQQNIFKNCSFNSCDINEIKSRDTILEQSELLNCVIDNLVYQSKNHSIVLDNSEIKDCTISDNLSFIVGRSAKFSNCDFKKGGDLLFEPTVVNNVVIENCNIAKMLFLLHMKNSSVIVNNCSLDSVAVDAAINKSGLIITNCNVNKNDLEIILLDNAGVANDLKIELTNNKMSADINLNFMRTKFQKFELICNDSDRIPIFNLIDDSFIKDLVLDVKALKNISNSDDSADYQDDSDYIINKLIDDKSKFEKIGKVTTL
jgi:hypothetical protein